MKHLISIIGPTAVGKTALSLQLARTLQTEIISTDSRQFYQEMDIGTAKPGPAALAEIPHHFINSLRPDQACNAASFAAEADELIAKLFAQHDYLITVGGSTLYINALWNGMDPMPEVGPEVRHQLREAWQKQGLEPLLEELQQADPETYQHIDRQNPARVLRALEVYRASGSPISTFRKGHKTKERTYQLWKIGLQDERSVLYQRINQRVDQMLENGLEAEVRALLTKYPPELNAFQSIGYQELIGYFAGKYDRQEAIRLIKRNSRRYAKRQMTWFRRDQEIQWFPAGSVHPVISWLQSQWQD